MQFKLDENLPSSLIGLFRDAGHDAVTARDQGLQGAPDERLFDVCQQEQRAFVTLDLGFADIRAYPPEEHAGVIVLRLRHQDVPYIRATVAKAVQMMEEHPVKGTLWIVEHDRVRFRN